MNKRVRAIIFSSGNILLMHRRKPKEEYWVFPGGGVELGEDNEVALSRECQEELGLRVQLEELAQTMASQKPEIEGQIEYFYLCSITGGQLGTGDGPEFRSSNIEEGKYEPEWVSLKSLSKMDLRPHQIRDWIIGRY